MSKRNDIGKLLEIELYVDSDERGPYLEIVFYGDSGSHGGKVTIRGIEKYERHAMQSIPTAKYRNPLKQLGHELLNDPDEVLEKFYKNIDLEKE